MIPRKTGTIVLAGIILVMAGLMIANMLLVTRPSIIQINDGTFKVLEPPYTYTKNDAYVLIVSSAIGGMMLSYIITVLFMAERVGVKKNVISIKDEFKLVDVVLTALKGDEKELIKQIANNRGELLQNELGLSLNFSKSKVSRMLTSLEKRGLVIKKQYGLTNKVTLADKLRGEKIDK